jgi:hypothetical protein
MKTIIYLSILGFIYLNSFVSKDNVTSSVTSKAIYREVSLQANSFQKEGGGFFNIPFPLTPYDATTY